MKKLTSSFFQKLNDWRKTLLWVYYAFISGYVLFLSVQRGPDLNYWNASLEYMIKIGFNDCFSGSYVSKVTALSLARIYLLS